MQNGLKLHFIQNYTNCQCQIIVLKCCFFLTNDRGEAAHTSKKQWLFQNRKSKNKKENKKIIVIIPKERCTKTGSWSQVKPSMAHGKFPVMSCIHRNLFFLLQEWPTLPHWLRKWFSISQWNRYPSSNDHWWVPVCQVVRHEVKCWRGSYSLRPQRAYGQMT